MNAELVARVRTRVARDFGPELVAHDLDHLDRVAALARQIALEERQDDVLPQIIAYVHDYHRVAEAELNEPVSSSYVLPRITALLEELDVPRDSVAEIVHAVEFNERYLIKGDTLDGGSQAAHIVRDADKLDAIGAIGIARAFMYGGSQGAPMWDPAASRQTVYVSGRTSSVIAHFYEKLVRLPQEMLTVAGRRIADDRLEYLLTFLRKFHGEWGDAASAPVNDLDCPPDIAQRRRP